AGMGDTVSCGLTRRVRQGMGYDDVVSDNSRAYGAGVLAGDGVNVGLMFASPCGAAGLVRGTVRGLNGAEAADNGIAAGAGRRGVRRAAEHRVLVRGRGWTAARDLIAGDRFRAHDGKEVVLEKVVLVEDDVPVHNLRVADFHTYFVGNREWSFSVWAHNDYNL